MNAKKSHERRGVAFFVLVFMLLVIVMGCVKLMIQQEVSQQRSDRQKYRTQILKSAIDIGMELGLKPGESVTLPVDEKSQQVVRMSLDESAENWVATWLKDNRELDSLIQKKTK